MNALNRHTEKVVIAHTALIGMNALSAEERNTILDMLTRLVDLPPDQWPSDRIHLRRPQTALYMMEATDQLRVFFRRGSDGTLTIEDLVLQETLDRYCPATTAQG